LLLLLLLLPALGFLAVSRKHSFTNTILEALQWPP
jgi:hypothetical protein